MPTWYSAMDWPNTPLQDVEVLQGARGLRSSLPFLHVFTRAPCMLISLLVKHRTLC